mgnify:CR=1 FL=1|tara:strand:- start:339 stop:644 length:306 start_codon:yes stop_codon:yes gene_type:complete
MTLITALKIMKMSANALTKKYGSRAMGISKRVKAGDIVTKAKKGGRLLTNNKGGKSFKSAQTSPKQLKKEKRAMQQNDAEDRYKAERIKSEQRDFDDARSD